MKDKALEWIEDKIMSYVDEKTDKFNSQQFMNDFKTIRDKICLSYPSVVEYMKEEPLFGCNATTDTFIKLMKSESPSEQDFTNFTNIVNNRPNNDKISIKQFSSNNEIIRTDIPPELGCIKIKQPETGFWVLAEMIEKDEDGCLFKSRGIVNNFYVVFEDLEWVPSKAFNTPDSNESHLMLNDLDEIKQRIEYLMRN